MTTTADKIPDPIKALTISQPFASLIADGTKWVENRSWYTEYRGPLAIHAGRGTQYLAPDVLREYPTGKVLCIAELISCVPLAALHALDRKVPMGSDLPITDGSSRTLREVLRHRHTEGPYCWVLENVRRIVPVQCVGMQGLWTFDRNLAVWQDVPADSCR